ncbi:MAG: class I SAM-dependent methyltransferase [Acidimicrobiales bacterium]|nr:class I SAM-dependent methyltransferase [Acidimicrobiales bacterium]
MTTCPVCNSRDTTVKRGSTLSGPLLSENLRVTDRSYGSTALLYRCRSCRFVFADPEEVHTVVRLYTDLVDLDYEATAKTRRRQMDALVDSIFAYRPQVKTLLDVGAGIGLMLEAARARGLAAHGVEPSKWMVDTARAREIEGMHEGTIPHPSLAMSVFDAVTIVDVIEHVEDPVGLLLAAADYLDANGILVLVTPDVGSLPARILGKRWWHYRPAHIGYFDKKSLTHAAEEAGLAVVCRTRASWWFPVGYVAERVTTFFPALRLVHHKLTGSRFYGRTVRLNLFDSWLMLLEKQ